MANFTERDEGKPVVMGDEKVGMISRVEHGTAHVKPDAGITDKIKSTLDWGDADEDTYPIEENHVETITDDEVRLESHM
ncbi:PRC-barrel domain containing protein [Halorussus amylolyticus]|uniref:PRC-barrel domain containing protein n=1 Tax=Halorussus amylolyticus TaxID=1126242 RepID=UPI00104839F9|nr:PRC-barrel domain containing protein [Halorussus amylolyticus]